MDELEMLLELHGDRIESSSRESYRMLYNTSYDYFLSDGIGDDYTIVDNFIRSTILDKLREVAHWQHVLSKPEEPF